MTRWRGRIGPEKLNALNAPEVECITKGKARTCYVPIRRVPPCR